ncbi:MAG: hypothetical protein ACE37J_16365 [Pikeienuella sp.]|uniref:hypothetical protein n=1 Tax=Pikeienuella sp. TaxID=2831957 RepID=UPI003919D858
MSPASPDMVSGRTDAALLAEAAAAFAAGLGLAVLGQLAMLPLLGLLATWLRGRLTVSPRLRGGSVS